MHVIETENSYWANDGLQFSEIEPVVINFDSSDSDSSDSDVDSDLDSVIYATYICMALFCCFKPYIISFRLWQNYRTIGLIRYPKKILFFFTENAWTFLKCDMNKLAPGITI